MCTCEGTQPGNGSQPKQSEKHVQMGGGGGQRGAEYQIPSKENICMEEQAAVAAVGNCLYEKK